jgi:hypothetical protein
MSNSGAKRLKRLCTLIADLINTKKKSLITYLKDKEVMLVDTPVLYERFL